MRPFAVFGTSNPTKSVFLAFAINAPSIPKEPAFSSLFPVTGEYGSVRVLNKEDRTKFVGHHFKEDELTELLGNHGIKVERSEKVKVIRAVSGMIRDTWNIWGIKV